MLKLDTQRQDTWTDSANERFATVNDSLSLPTNELLTAIIADPDCHARLLNTLALLEHTGSYRIMLSQHGAQCEQSTLRHLAEEAGHAAFMKRQAERIAGRAMEFADSDLLAGPTARSYFRRLEARIHHRLRNEGSATATYLYMSMIIEFRAVWFYERYQQALKRAGAAISLKRILGEEAHHLTEMATRLEAIDALNNQRVDSFLAIEQRLYTRLLTALSGHC